MSKRRRASSGASRGADLDDSDDGIDHNPGPPPSRKKKKFDPGEMCQQLYDTIRSFKKEDGTLLCDSFIQAPKRRQEPQYYEVVSQPIDLLRDSKPQFTNLFNTTIGQDVEMMLENSLDEPSLASPATPLSIGGNSNPYNPALSTTQERTQTATPASSKKKKESKQKIVTGYILYSSEVRKAIIANNPESTFGEMSRIVGNEWRSLPPATKQSWEERAARCNEETAAKLAVDPETQMQMEMTYECSWDTCDYQFEDLGDCLEHCVENGPNNANAAGHLQNHYRGSFSEYTCVWRNCARVRKGQAPFPNLPRLVRHVRDLHVYKGNGRLMHLHERTRNYVPSTRKPRIINIRGGVMWPGDTSKVSTPSRNTSLHGRSP